MSQLHIFEFFILICLFFSNYSQCDGTHRYLITNQERGQGAWWQCWLKVDECLKTDLVEQWGKIL